MRNAYALLGVSFLVVFGGAYLLIEQANSPIPKEQLATDNTSASMELTLTSRTFEDGATIPRKFTCDGDNTNPPLLIAGIPEEAQSLVLVMDDPDIPQEVKDNMGIEKFDHWAVYNIPADTTEIMEGGAVGTTALNSSGEIGYAGPCPPSQYEPTEHRYIFRLYALPIELSFEKTPTLDEIEAAAQERALAKTVLVGRYERPQ